jgi:hypothetical protein
VLVRWRDADTWLLLPTAVAVTPSPAPARTGVVAISPVARRFGGTPTIRGWCCASR